MVNDLADELTQAAEVDAFNPDARMAARSIFEAQERVFKLVPRILEALRRPVPADVADLVERLSKRADKIRGYIASSQIVVDLLKPEMDKFDARTGHDLYTVRMAVDHESGIRTQTKELDDLDKAAALLTTLASVRDEWLPIETAPSNIDIDVWVTALEGEGWRMTGRLIANDPGCLETEDGDTYWPDQNGGYFTHWRPLPTPPQGDQQ